MGEKRRYRERNCTYSSDNRSRPQMDGVSFRQLSHSHVSFLEGHFKKEKIREAIFGLRNDRAPGPDGFPIAFFLHFWKLFEDDLLLFSFLFFDEFHANGVLTCELGATFISLITKKDGVVSIKDYRPISLIGSIYKILAKVLANRLMEVLPKIISEFQGAFVEGRQILDSVLIAHECIDSRNRQRHPGLVCKLEFEKAYDMVDWWFLRYELDRMVSVKNGVLSFVCSFLYFDEWVSKRLF